MSINGRINIDAVFHDTDGTASISVVSLNDSLEYSTGVVAIMTRTANSVIHTVPLTPSTYPDATGQPVSFASVDHVVLKSNYGNIVYNDGYVSMNLQPGEVSSFPVRFSVADDFMEIFADIGTGSYTIILHGVAP